MPVVGIGSFGPESGDFVGNVIENYSERTMLQPGFRHPFTAEHFRHFLRAGGSAQIPVMRLNGHQGITDAASYGIGGEARLFQPGNQVFHRVRKFHLRSFPISRRSAAGGVPAQKHYE